MIITSSSASVKTYWTGESKDLGVINERIYFMEYYVCTTLMTRVNRKGDEALWCYDLFIGEANAASGNSCFESVFKFKSQAAANKAGVEHARTLVEKNELEESNGF